jgi:NOL1/NOP2/fmu family ribosome biogenesis protein
MKITFVNKMEKEKLIDELGRFGIKEIPFLLIRSSVDRIRAYSGNLDADSLARLAEKVYVETIGLYFARLDGKDLRLSLDALHLLKEQITDNIIELDDEQFEEYIKGRDIELNAGQKDKFADKLGYFVLRYKDDLIGMAKIISGKFIKNYLPKERRRKS